MNGLVCFYQTGTERSSIINHVFGGLDLYPGLDEHEENRKKAVLIGASKAMRKRRGRTLPNSMQLNLGHLRRF